jgi:hypothetical protein
MARKRERPSELESGDRERAKSDGELERLGPVSIERMSKDDGRTLIVYSAVEPPEQ